MFKSESCKTVKPKKVDKFRRHPISAAFLEAVKFYFSPLSFSLSQTHTHMHTHTHAHTHMLAHTHSLKKICWLFALTPPCCFLFSHFNQIFSQDLFSFSLSFQSPLSYLLHYFFILIYLYDFFSFISHSSHPSSCLNNHFHDRIHEWP